MNATLKMGLLVASIGMALNANPASAAVAAHTAYSNAVNYCQAFTPGVSNTIRNRVIGSENIGSPIAVACNFHLATNGAAGQSSITGFAVLFTNGTTTATPVTCTMLTGTSAGISGTGSQYAVTKTVTVPASSANAIGFNTADNPTAGATDLGNLLVGVNCTLPTNMTMSATIVEWNANNGV